MHYLLIKNEIGGAKSTHGGDENFIT